MNIGVCGTGTVASWISDTICQLKDEKIVLYACATSPGFDCSEFAEKYGYQKLFPDFETLMQDENVDLVYIAVPNSMHYELCMKAIACGKNVVCEKPFAMGAKQCKEMLDAAHERNVFISEALWTMFLPVYQTVKEKLAAGCIGTVQSMTIKMLDNLMFLDRVKNPKTGGGILLDEGPYVLGSMTAFLGTDIKSVKSRIRRLDSGVDAEDEIEVEYENGVKAYLHQAMDMPEEKIDKYVEITGSKGKIWMNDIGNPSCVKILDLDGNVVEELEIPAQITFRGMPPVSGYEYEWQGFEKALREGAKECPQIPNATTLAIAQIMSEVLGLS